MKDKSSEKEDFIIVGLGASAGGIEAFKQFFQAVPDDSGMAFVLVQHLDPTHESMMVDLLSRFTRMEVRQVTDGIKVEPDHVYIIPPNKSLTIHDGRLHIGEPEQRRGMRSPIDGFFRSLASERGERAVAIVLSGTASDGTEGLREIKLQGGLAIAQDPNEAQQDGMPRSALNAGVVDYAVPVAEMPRLLAEYAQHPGMTKSRGCAAEEVKDVAGLDGVLAVLRIRLGHDFRGYKKGMVLRRIRRRMAAQQREDLRAYRDFLREHPDEVKALLRDLLIGVTTFFREKDAWKELEKHTIPSLLDRHDESAPIRIWVAGCATGKEAYSLLMLLIEEADRRERRLNCQIFATDIDQEALEVARDGIYPAQIAEEMSAERLNRFFVNHGNTYQIRKDLRERITFAAQNIVTDPPFSNMDLISCRNLMIYLDLQVQKRLIDLFHFALAEGGFLFLGNSESVGNQDDLFEVVSRKWRIYRKIGVSHPMRLSLPLVKAMSEPTETKRPRRPAATAANEKAPALLLERALLGHFAPAAALVDGRGNVLYFHGDMENFLMIHEGEPTRDLLALVRKGLRGQLRTAVQRACKEGTRSVFRAYAMRGKGGQPVRITTIPLVEDNMAVVAFETEGPAIEKLPEPVSVDEATLRTLEDELKATREELQNTVEELETSNEELKAANEEAMSMNEELQSTNEELETSKEELQSVNEELTTVNAQLREKVDELEQTNNDLDNLITSTDIATIFLDSAQKLKRYSPATTKLLNLIPGDIGRPISDVSSKLAGMNLTEDADRVLADLRPVQREFQCEDGQWYIRNTLPYRTSRNTIEGTVITFVDVTELKRAQEEQWHRSAELQALMESVPAAVWLTNDPDCRQITGNRLGYSMLRLTRDRNVSKSAPAEERPSYRTFQEGRELAPEELPLQRAAAGQTVQDCELDILFEDGDLITIFGSAVPLKDQTGQIRGAVAAFIDITARKRAEQAMAESEHLYRLAAQAAHFGTYARDLLAGRDYWSPELKAIYGLDPDDAFPLRDGIPEAVHPDDRDRVARETRARIAPDAPEEYGEEHRIIRRDGAVRWVLVRGRVEFAGDGPQRRAVRKYGFVMDFTDRKQAEIEIHELNAHLEQKVQEKTEETRRQAEQLRSLVRQLTDAEQRERQRLSAMLHDHIQQLLVAARYQLSTVSNRVADEKVAQALEKANNTLVEAVHASRNLAVELSPPILYNGALESAIRWLADYIHTRHGLDVEVRSDLEGRPVEDHRRVMLFECVRELLLNVVKHSGASHTVVELHEETPDTLRLSVQDNGKGFDLRVLDRDESCNHYGLFHIRQRLEAVGGQLVVDSHPSKGTRVTLLCPVNPPGEALDEEDIDPTVLSPREESLADEMIHIVLADDHTIFREGLRTMLELEPEFKIVGEASNGHEAVRLARELRPDVVLMDVNMPEMDGIEATRALRRDRPDVQVIGLTMHQESAVHEDMVSAGAASVFHKTTDASSLREAILRVARSRS